MHVMRPAWNQDNPLPSTLKMTIAFQNEVVALIAGDECLKVTILHRDIIPFPAEKVTDYLKRGFPPCQAVAACIGWRAGTWEMHEDGKMMGH